jgi:hypothetical protein
MDGHHDLDGMKEKFIFRAPIEDALRSLLTGDSAEFIEIFNCNFIAELESDFHQLNTLDLVSRLKAD